MGCCIPGANPYMIMSNAGTAKAAINKAAFDLNVPEHTLKCINQWTGVGQSIYILQMGDNSDELYRYENIGTIYRKIEYNPPYIDGINEEGKPSNHPVIARVAFDLNVNKSQIKMVRKREGRGDGDYILQVHDKYLKYKKVGSTYLPENQSVI
eukprot:161114_1